MLRTLARLFHKLTGTYPANLSERWEVDSEAPVLMSPKEDHMNIPVRELLTRAQRDINTLRVILDADAPPGMEPTKGNSIDIARTTDTLNDLGRFLADHKPGDTVAVELPVETARAIRRFVQTTGDLADVLDDGDTVTSWDSVDEAIAEALAAYDGPDGDDGRAFEDAQGRPHYEP